MFTASQWTFQRENNIPPLVLCALKKTDYFQFAELVILCLINSNADQIYNLVAVDFAHVVFDPMERVWNETF